MNFKLGFRATRKALPSGLALPCVLSALMASIPFTSPAFAQCGAEKPPLRIYTGGGQVVCPCFVTGEEAGVVLQAPPTDDPIEILRIGIGWGSQFGGAEQTLEESINVYAAGLPNPGDPIFTLVGPVMNDGSINEFNLEPQPDRVGVKNTFAVTLTFSNSNAGDIFAPSVVHDGNGCQAGRNLIRTQPGGAWADACAMGVTGDWVFYVIYRPCQALAGVGDGLGVLSTSPAFLMPPRPNPAHGSVELEFMLATAGRVNLAVHDISGRRIAQLAQGNYASGVHRLKWDGRTSRGEAAAPGMYFVRMDTEAKQLRRSLLVTR